MRQFTTIERRVTRRAQGVPGRLKFDELFRQPDRRANPWTTTPVKLVQKSINVDFETRVKHSANVTCTEHLLRVELAYRTGALE